jgi:hypothetical protein
MPGSQHRVLKIATAVGAVQGALFLLAARAVAAPSPSPSDNKCDLIVGPAKQFC